MSIRPIALDVNLEKGIMSRFDWTSTITQKHRTAPFLFLLPFIEAHVRYESD